MLDIEYHYATSPGMELIFARRRPRRYPRHFHARHWTAGKVRSGSLVLSTNDGVRTLHAGQSFLIRPREVHSLDIAAGSELTVACFDETAPTSFPDALRSMLHAAPFSFTIAEDDFAGLSFLETEDASCSPAPDTPVGAVFRLLLSHPEETFPLERMASYAGYSPWHFLRSFCKECGMTPHAFQLVCRLGLVRSLLRTNTAAAEAAVSAGFTDQSHMHRLFKRHHGLTPRQFARASFRLAV